MRLHLKKNSAMSLAETMVAAALIGSGTIVVYSLLTSGMLLGAKNTAMNTAHQQARVAMLQIVQDLHSSVSLPRLADEDGNPPPDPTPTPSPAPSPTPMPIPTPAAGISFYLWRIGPLRVAADANPGDTTVQVTIPAGVAVPVVEASPSPPPRLIIRSHEVEEDIVSITGVTGTAGGTATFTLAHPLPTPTSTSTSAGTTIAASTTHIVCFVADRCAYAVKNAGTTANPQYQLQWHGPAYRKSFAVMGSGMTNLTPFSLKLSPTSAPLYQIVAAFDLSTADPNYTNRGFKSSNILLKGEVPIRARLTDKQ